MLRSILLSLCLRLFTCIASLAATSKAHCFPPDFLFGTATAAFQVENAWSVSNQEPSILDDDDCRSQPHLQCTDVADDFFDRYRDDVQRMSDMGMSSFRFSISWSRVMHWDAETRRMQPNARGIASYHALLDALQTKALQPIATLYQLDLPLMLQTQLEPNGWLNPDIVTYFEDFAKLAFREFGGKVKYWATFDEPLTFINGGYGLRDTALDAVESSDTNAYTVAHNVLLSHAKAVALFRALKENETNSVAANARIGIALNAELGYPVNESDENDVKAAERKMQLDLGWFLMPIVAGEYPKIMRERVGERLPRFSADEVALVKGSYDVFMLNNYYLRIMTNCDLEHLKISCDELPQGHARDTGIDDTRAPNGARMPPASRPECSWLADDPDGYLATIKWLHQKDPSTEILLTEKGWCGNDQVNNLDQLRYFQVYVGQVYKAIVEEKIPIIGYTAWLLDNNERNSDKPQVGLHYANFTSRSMQGRPRIPRSATKWLAHLSTTKCLDGWDQGTIELDVGEKEAAAPHEKRLNPEAGGNDVGAPWSLGEVVILIIIGVLVLGAITCEVMRELRMSSQGSSEEVQVLITIED